VEGGLNRRGESLIVELGLPADRARGARRLAATTRIADAMPGADTCWCAWHAERGGMAR
jgi:hypothetical protein